VGGYEFIHMKHEPCFFHDEVNASQTTS
jgi:hypothetical protein